MNILFIVFKGIGDVILTTPSIKVFKSKEPDTKIYFLTRKFASPVLKNNPYIEKIFAREEVSLKDIFCKMDFCLDYMLSSSSLFYTLISGAKKRIAFYRKYNFFYNCRVKDNFRGYAAIKRLYLLKPFGIEPENLSYDDVKPEIFLDDECLSNALAKLSENGIDKNDRIITFDITSPRTYRQLEGYKFIYIADKISELGFKIVFIPAPSETDYVENTIKTYSRKKHFLIKNTSLLEAAAIISMAKLHIGTSSAPMHMAVSFNVPTFTVYSPYTDPISWTPPFGKNDYVYGEFKKLREDEIYLKIFEFMKKIKII
jgi:ADP-heptose:LPS heptosyltransferase